MADFTWESLHLAPEKAPDVFLTTVYKAFVAEHFWQVPGRRCFFIRYHDETGLHLRLRFKAEADWMANRFPALFQKAFKRTGEWTAVPYQPETERFGGPEAMAWAEEHFHISTQVVLARLARGERDYNANVLDALKLHTAVGMAAGLTAAEAKSWFAKLSEQWIAMFFTPAEPDMGAAELLEAVQTDFQEILAPQADFLADALLQVRKDWEAGIFDKSQPEWLRWYRGNEIILPELKEQKAKALPSLIHLTNNRLGINNQDEAYLMYVLGAL